MCDDTKRSYYSWKDAGVDISYGGATTAAAEAQGLDEAGKTVSFDELQPGDLIFYSFTSNGRYKNISHVAVYVGNGKVVEALNESLGVVYRDVASTGKIVVIGRPCETVETIGKRNSCTIDTHYLKQREALNTALPIGVRQVETMRTLLTQSLAVLMPFNVQELNDSTGNYYGINQISKNVNIGNRKKLINGNGFVFGVPGSGKSFFCKMEMGSVFLSGDDEIIVIDPMNEYFDIAETYGGTVVNMSTYTDNYVNPLEMDVWSLDPNDSKGMVREKGEFMLGLCEQCIGDSLNSRQKSIIDRCVRKLYIDIARSKEKYIPVMSDFYDILMAQPEDEAKDIALSLGSIPKFV